LSYPKYKELGLNTVNTIDDARFIGREPGWTKYIYFRLMWSLKIFALLRRRL